MKISNYSVHFHGLWKATKYSHQIQDGQSLSHIVPSGGWCVWIYTLDMFPGSHVKSRGKKWPQIRRSVHIFSKAPHNTPHFPILFLVFCLPEGRNFSHKSWGRTSRCRSLLNCNEKFRKVWGDRAWYLWAVLSLAAWERNSKSLGFFPSFCSSSWAGSITLSSGYWCLGDGALDFTVSLSG